MFLWWKYQIGRVKVLPECLASKGLKKKKNNTQRHDWDYQKERRQRGSALTTDSEMRHGSTANGGKVWLLYLVT